MLALLLVLPASSVAQHLVISEVGSNATGATPCDYVELYNPTSVAISVLGLSLQRVTGSPGFIINIPLPDESVPAYGFFLVADDQWLASGCNPLRSADWESNLVLNDDDAVLLVSNAIDVSSCSDPGVIDAVAWGANGCGEGSAALNIPEAGSLERKATATSTSTSMALGGAEESVGNSYDTEDNSVDIIPHLFLQLPQNSMSPAEVPPGSTISVLGVVGSLGLGSVLMGFGAALAIRRRNVS